MPASRSSGGWSSIVPRATARGTRPGEGKGNRPGWESRAHPRVGPAWRSAGDAPRAGPSTSRCSGRGAHPYDLRTGRDQHGSAMRTNRRPRGSWTHRRRIAAPTRSPGPGGAFSKGPERHRGSRCGGRGRDGPRERGHGHRPGIGCAAVLSHGHVASELSTRAVLQRCALAELLEPFHGSMASLCPDGALAQGLPPGPAHETRCHSLGDRAVSALSGAPVCPCAVSSDIPAAWHPAEAPGTGRRWRSGGVRSGLPRRRSRLAIRRSGRRSGKTGGRRDPGSRRHDGAAVGGPIFPS